ncbi:hypothetical protein BHU62_12145 [Serratia marcescens]|uniref:Uncharacterized protein n=1 Tax=Serratia marcescens TaxID=615 RepID=A0A1Q4P0H1_SERMA|nr:hypothetical protein BHU62_12145 [Serratia marcescens]
MFFYLCYRWRWGFSVKFIACRIVIKHVYNTMATCSPIQNVFFIWVKSISDLLTEKIVIESFVFPFQFYRQRAVFMFVIHIIIIFFI